MKTSRMLFAVLGAIFISGANFILHAQTGGFAVTERGADYRVLQKTTVENGVSRVHSYTELASGLNHRVNGQWIESKEWIDILPNGTAMATNGQHQAFFPGDIYQGQIELVTPDGKHLKSRPLGLSYFDGVNTVLIAELTNSVGVVVGSNQVVYPNAFTDFKVDLRYTYTRGGFEQDVVLQQQPPTPESLGLNPATTRLQILTEFISPPQPVIQATKQPVQAGLSLTDQNLDFGTMQMIAGRAFMMGANATDAGALVSKHWQLLNGRQFLVEEVPVDAIVEGLADLPLTAMNSTSSKQSHTASKHLDLPPQRLAKASPHVRLIAKADLPAQGFVLDYVIITSSKSSYTFQGDTTYYLLGSINLTGANIFEGNAVIKYAAHTTLSSSTQLVFKTGPYRPVIFTAKDDNSVGETISGSTGHPTNYYANIALSLSSIPTQPLSGLRILFATTALAAANTSLTLTNAQFVNCNVGLAATGGKTNVVSNALFANVTTNFSLPGNDQSVVLANNDTFYNANAILNYNNGTGGNAPTGFGVNSLPSPAVYVILTNCVLANVTNVAGVTSADHNGFYRTPPIGSSPTTNTFYPFQTVGAGSFYLTNGCAFTNAGTSQLDLALLADLGQKTTCPPLVYSNATVSVATNFSPQAQRDTDVLDLGYHYDPIDYITDNYSVTNATLTIAGGTVFACYNDVGIWLRDGSAISSIGTPAAPNWFIYYRCAQEQPVSLGTTPYFLYAKNFCPTNNSGTKANGVFQFSKFIRPSGNNNQFYDDYDYCYGSLLVQDCELWSGFNDFSGAASTTITIKNTLFARSRFWASDSSGVNDTLTLSNNLFWKITGGTADLQIYHYGSGTWSLFNNDFDTCRIDVLGTITINGYNSFLNCSDYGRLYPNSANDVVTNAGLAYQTGPLGDFYQPTNSPLFDRGSTTAANAGLAAYTAQTSHTPDTSTVDIGLHYPVIDSTGTDFWIVFMGMSANLDLSLYISSGTGATGTVAIPYFSSTSTFTVAAGAVTNIPIFGSIMLLSYDMIESKGIHITASQPISIYAFNYASAASGAFTCYPTPLLGTKYCVMAHEISINLNGNSEFAVVATVDNTTVTIAPSPMAYLVLGHTNAYRVTLQQGQTYQMIGTNDTYDGLLGDVTGTFITSDKPVGVFAGASSADVPTGVYAANPLVQEQLPVESWGTQALSMGFAGRTNGDSYRVLAAYDGTIVYTNGTLAGTNQAGGFIDLTNIGPIVFEASKPIQVAHFANGATFDDEFNTEGDPCEILLPPTGHYLLTNIVYTPYYYNANLDSPGFDQNYLNLIVPQSATNSTFINVTNAVTNFVAIGNSGYYGTQLPATNQVYKVTSSQPIGIEVYGFGFRDAYGYFGGVVR